MIVGVGIDVVDLRALRTGLSEPVVRKLFLPDEIAYARTQARWWQSLGARLAVKRAVLKALVPCPEQGRPCECWGPPSSRSHTERVPLCGEIEILREPSGALDVVLHGTILRLALERRVSVCVVSVSHTRSLAMAVAVARDSEA